MTIDVDAVWGRWLTQSTRSEVEAFLEYVPRAEKRRCVLRDQNGNVIVTGTIDMDSLTGHMQPAKVNPNA